MATKPSPRRTPTSEMQQNQLYQISQQQQVYQQQQQQPQYLQIRIKTPEPGWELGNKCRYQEGEKVHFEARVAPATDNDLKVEWYHNDKPLISGDRFRSTHDSGHILLDILYVYPEDAGVYKCVASNGVGSASSEFEIQVLSKSSLVDCKQSSDFQRNEQQLTSANDSMIINPSTVSNFNEPNIQRFGDTQVIWNRSPVSPAAAPEIGPRQAPQFELRPVSCTAFEGSSARFYCRLIGNPKPNITWVHNGHKIETSGPHYKLSYDGMYHLTILDCKTCDSGNVEVWANNQLGTCQAIAQLTINQRVEDYRNALKGSPNHWYALTLEYGTESASNNELPEVNIQSPNSPLIQLAQSPGDSISRAVAPSTVGRAIKSRESIRSSDTNTYHKRSIEGTNDRRTHSSPSRVAYDRSASPMQQQQQYLISDNSQREQLYDQQQHQPRNLPSASNIQYHSNGARMVQQQQETLVINQFGLAASDRNSPMHHEGNNELSHRKHTSASDSIQNNGNNRAHDMQSQANKSTPTNRQQLSYSQKAIQNQQQYHQVNQSDQVNQAHQEKQQQKQQLTKQQQYLQYMINKEKTPEPSWTAHRVPDLDSVQSDPLYQDLMLELQRLEENVSAVPSSHYSVSDSPLVPECKERPRFTQRIIPERVELDESESCEFMCRLEPSSDPSMKVDWFHNGEPLREGSRYTVEFDFGVARLVIRRCEADDSGVYQCVARNLLGEGTSSGTLRVNAKAAVQYDTLNPSGLDKIMALENPVAHEETVEQVVGVPPKFVTQIVDYVEKDESQSLHLECNLAPVDDPDMKTEWFFNGRPLVTGSRFHTIDDFGFIVLDIDWLFPRDTGEYVCRATNKHGSDITRCVLRVRPDKNIVLDSQIDDPNLIDKLHQLEFPDVVEPEIVLEPNKPAHFVQHLSAQGNKILYQEGENVHFEARVAPATDGNLTVEWFHNDRPLMSGHRFKPALDFGHILLDILYVYPEDAGIYKCVATNGIGTDTSQFEIQVHGKPGLDYRTQLPDDMVGGVQKLTDMEAMWNRAPDPEEEEAPQARMAPEFVLKPVPCTAFENSSARFCCRIIGHPRPRLTWAINGQTVFSGSRYRLTYDGMYHLTILKCQLTDAGKVEVYARNPLGDCLAMTQLNVRPKVDDYRNVLKRSPNPWYDEQVLRQYRRQRLADTNNDLDLDDILEDPNSSLMSTPLIDPNGEPRPRLTLGLPSQSYGVVGYMEPGTPDVNLLAPNSPLVAPGPAHPAVARAEVTRAPAPSTIGRALKARNTIKSPEKSFTIEDHGRPTHSALHVAIENAPPALQLRHPRHGSPEKQRFHYEYQEQLKPETQSPDIQTPSTGSASTSASNQYQNMSMIMQEQQQTEKPPVRQVYGIRPVQTSLPKAPSFDVNSKRPGDKSQSKPQISSVASQAHTQFQDANPSQQVEQQRANYEQQQQQFEREQKLIADQQEKQQNQRQIRAQNQSQLKQNQLKNQNQKQTGTIDQDKRGGHEAETNNKTNRQVGANATAGSTTGEQQQQRAGSEARASRTGTPGPEEGVSGREVHLHTQQQTLVERRHNKEIRRDIIEREVFEQEHKGEITLVDKQIAGSQRGQTPQRQFGGPLIDNEPPQQSHQQQSWFYNSRRTPSIASLSASEIGSSVSSTQNSDRNFGQSSQKQVHFRTDHDGRVIEESPMEQEFATDEMVPPEFTQKIQPCQAIEGDEAIFECCFIGDPLPKISWFRENRPIRQSNLYQIITDQYKSKLIIKRVTLNANAVFTVKAENEAGSAKSSANLVVDAHPRPETNRGGRAVQIDADHYVFNDEEFVDEEGGNGEKSAASGGVASSSIRTASAATSSDERQQHHQHGSTKFSIPNREPTPEIISVGDNNEGDEKQVVLSVRTRKLSPDDLAALIRRSPEGLVAPSFLHSIHDIVCRPGELVRLDARVLGSGPLEVRWLKDGARLRADKLHKMLLEADLYTLLILECTPEDSGSYECVVANRVGEARCRAKLLVSNQLADSRSRTPEPFSSSGQAASSYSFRASSAASNASSQSGAGPNLIGTRSSESPSRSLQFNSANTNLSDSIPKIIKRLESQSVREGCAVTLRCQISSFPVPPQVQWFKDGDKLIKPSRYFRIFKDNEETYCLRISEAFAEDAGEYKCVARALNGRSYVETRAHVNVVN